MSIIIPQPPANLLIKRSPKSGDNISEFRGQPPILSVHRFTSEDIARLRHALVEDLGVDKGWSDNEVSEMANSTLEAFLVLRKIIRRRRQE